MTAEEARLLIRYSGWASGKLLDAAANLTAEQRTRPMNVSHESLQRTLGHIYHADLIWYIRLVDSSLATPDWDALPAMETLAREWLEVQRKWETWSDSVAGSDLDRVVQYKLRNGSPGETPAWQIVVHVVNHATLHRGQVVGMLRQLGVTPPATDILWYYRELKAAAAP